jgi:hypothetical protein
MQSISVVASLLLILALGACVDDLPPRECAIAGDCKSAGISLFSVGSVRLYRPRRTTSSR